MDNSVESISNHFKLKFWYGTKVLLLFLLIIASGFFIPNLLFLLFGGILFSIFLNSISSFLREKTHLKYGVCLFITLLFFTLSFTLIGYFLAPSLAHQFDQLTKDLPLAFSKLMNKFSQYSWAQVIKNEAKPESVIENSPDLLRKATNAFGNAIEWVTNILIMALIGLYCAFEPSVYSKGTIKLFPKAKRPRVIQVMNEIDETLRWWLIGKFFGMFVIGVLTMIGLTLLKVPLALALAIIAAILTFIPNIGPIISAAPAVLLGFVESPQKALYIALLYLGIQTIESYLLTPMVQRKTISLPPALTLSAQVVFGYVIGGIGVAFATPFTAIILVLVKMLYIEDKLHDKVELNGN